MAENGFESRRKRLRAIEDRKIAILLEFGQINKRMMELKSEYLILGKEHYELWRQSI